MGLTAAKLFGFKVGQYHRMKKKSMWSVECVGVGVPHPDREDRRQESDREIATDRHALLCVCLCLCMYMCNWRQLIHSHQRIGDLSPL